MTQIFGWIIALRGVVSLLPRNEKWIRFGQSSIDIRREGIPNWSADMLHPGLVVEVSG